MDKEEYRPIAVWCAPRVLSHAFEKMMRSRGDHVVFAEPFNKAWYSGPERQTHRTSIPQDHGDTYAGQLEKIQSAARESPVFVRAMAWQMGKHLTPEMLGNFQGTIQLRDPAFALTSLHKVLPDFKEEEAGFGALHTAWTILRNMGQAAPVVDAIDLQTDPTGTVSLWCDAVGISRNTDALHWQPGFDQSWDYWKQWTSTVRESSGFRPPPSEQPAVPNERVAKIIDSCRVLYREMEAKKLRP